MMSSFERAAMRVWVRLARRLAEAGRIASSLISLAHPLISLF
jgi:hypothetical protein